MSLVVVTGEVTWAIQPAYDDQGTPILIARSDVFKSVLWGYSQDDLRRCMSDAMHLLISHFRERNRLSVLEDMGFRVERYTVVDSPGRPESETAPTLPQVNGTTNFLQPAAAHA